MKKEAYFKLMGLVKLAQPSWSDQQLTSFGVPQNQWSKYRYKYAGVPGGRRLLKKYLVGQGIYSPGQARPGDAQQLSDGTIKLTPQGIPNSNTTTTAPAAPQLRPTTPQSAPVTQPVKSNLLPERTTISDQASQY